MSLVPVGKIFGKGYKFANKILIKEGSEEVANVAEKKLVNGTIYEVPGSSTKTGKPYVGRHNQPNPAKTRKSNDGRDRSKAKVIDKYDPSNPQEGRIKEQKAIDERGGISNLDNKRNEIKKNKKDKE